MLKIVNMSLGIILLMGMTAASAAPLNLRSDSKTISKKARSIEVEYSRDMRNQNSGNSDADQTSHQGALIIEERVPTSQPVIITEPAVTNSDVGAADSFDEEYFSNSEASEDQYVGASSFNYSDNLKMRDDRKAGAGVVVGGALGSVGLQLELNFEDADGALAGFGTGPGFNSFQLAWKHNFAGRYLTPYVMGGYSRWYNSSGRSSDYRDSSILDRILTDNEKRTGQFGTDFVNASVGLQYNQLRGEFAGVSFFGEILAMYEVKRSILLPNGAVGALYFF